MNTNELRSILGTAGKRERAGSDSFHFNGTVSAAQLRALLGLGLISITAVGGWTLGLEFLPPPPTSGV